MILYVASKDDVASKKIVEETIYGYRFEGLLEPFRNCQIYHKVINGKEVNLITVMGNLRF